MGNTRKILVVGGAGYIGGYLTTRLSELKHYECSVYDNLLYEDRYLKDVHFIYGDVRDRKKLKSILPSYDAVVWLAAIVGDGACALDPYLTQSVNEDSVKWLVDNYKGKIIFTSTCSVYGANHALNLDEKTKTSPLSVYASTKLASEQYIIENSKNYLIFRLGTLFGLGDTYSRIRLDLVVNILTKRATKGEELTVYGGEQWRPLMHVKDVAGATLFGLEHDATGLYNLHDRNCTIKEIAIKIQECIPAVVKYQNILFEDARNYSVSSRAYKYLGWLPTYDLAFGIEEIARTVKEGRIRDTENPLYSNVHYLKKEK